MATTQRVVPEGARLAGVLLVIALLAGLSYRFGWHIEWGTALLYGLAMALSARWPIVLPRTGTRVMLMGGLALEAFWHHGPTTAFVVILIEFGARIFTLHGRRLWAWWHPLHAGSAMGMGYLVSTLVSGWEPLLGHGRVPLVTEANFTFAYVFWFTIVVGYAALASDGNETWVERLFTSMRQTWWTPLGYLVVAWVSEFLHGGAYPLSVLTVILLLATHYEIGTLATLLFQDRAIAYLRRITPAQSVAQRTRTYRVMRAVHLLAEGIALHHSEKRLVSYAALLQEWLPEQEPPTPLWLPELASKLDKERMQKRTQAVVDYLAQDGALLTVFSLIRMRHAAFDGSGDPAISGAEIPLAAQVLTAANALVAVQEQGYASSFDEAAAWIQAHASAKFSPQLVGVMTYTFRPGTVELVEGIPDAVQELKRLMPGSTEPTRLATLLHGLVRQVRGQIGMEPQLPSEVQAVARLAAILSSNTDTDRTAQITVEVIGQLTGGKVLLALNDGDDSGLLLRTRAGYGFSAINPVGALLDLQHPHLSRIVLEQSPGQVDNLAEIPTPAAREVALLEGIGSVLYVPLVARGRVIGLVMVAMRGYHWFTPREVGLIHLMSGQAAIALENGRLMTEATERLHKVEELKRFNETLLDNLSASILVVDTEGVVVTLNEAARTRFGVDPAVAVGKLLPDPLAAACQISRVLCGENAPETDYPWHSSILELQTVSLRDRRGRLLGAICLARDVTQVRAMQTEMRKVEKMVAVGELSAGAAHEIRNPLTAIRGFIQLLQLRAATSEEEYFRIIISEIDRIDGIIRDMLLLARPATVQWVKVSLAALLDEILLLHKSELERQLIQVKVEVHPSASVVAVDPNMFRQLLHNLFSNAIQAMPFGGILTLRAWPGGPEEVSLSIGDTGVGISPENLQRLFVPFFTTKAEGTGLGLALCYSIIQAHGGRIEVDSQEGKGTTFTITLPATPAG